MLLAALRWASATGIAASANRERRPIRLIDEVMKLGTF
jgi:hypothetical protein